MKRLTITLALLLLAGAVACGGGSDKKMAGGGASTADSGPTPTQPPLRTNAVAKALQTGLLRFEDTPAGWRMSQESAGKPENTDMCGANLATLEQQRQKLGEAGTAFDRGDSGPYVVETITAYPPGVAERVMADLAAAVQSCREVTIRDDEGSTSVWQLSPVSVPETGDQTLAFSEYWPPNGVEALVVYVRRGDRIMTLLSIAINSRVDRLQTETLLSRAYERFLRLESGR